MQFSILPVGVRPSADAKGQAFLLTDNWDDWFRFSTMYRLVFVDVAGVLHPVGDVKIGQIDMEEGQRRPRLPQTFEVLAEDFFSVGQDDAYYAALNDLGDAIRDEILVALRDMARDPAIFRAALPQTVTGVSLLRSVSKATVVGQFRRMTTGGARLSPFELSYTTPALQETTATTLTFDVQPEARPPTNIHVLIGRNGVGKTHLLDHMARAILPKAIQSSEFGSFQLGPDANRDGEILANLVSVTFSAFDPFDPLPERQDKSKGIRHSYIGLRRSGDSVQRPLPPKSQGQITKEFGAAVLVCRQGARNRRWKRALEMLEVDPIFKDANVAAIADADNDDKEIRARASRVFKRLSSGHKLVLLTTTRLVEVVEERTLVLLDEPEAHLHPPLLSAFVRALSDLLVDRNGVAIIATHSPVVLQEVPRKCAWKIRRVGRRMVAERPEIETFGENVGILTREVFGFEVTESGFHRLLRDSIADRSVSKSYSISAASWAQRLDPSYVGSLLPVIGRISGSVDCSSADATGAGCLSYVHW